MVAYCRKMSLRKLFSGPDIDDNKANVSLALQKTVALPSVSARHLSNDKSAK